MPRFMSAVCLFQQQGPRQTLRAVLLACLMGPASAMCAQDFPSRAMRFIVPFPPGGGTDLIARLIGKKLNEKWGYPVVVDNRPGANGAIGAELAARAAPDGHTLLMIISAHVVQSSVNARLPYNLVQDFAPVIHVAVVPNIVVVNPSLPVTTIRDLIALAKKKPGQVNFAGASMGGPSHLSGELFNYLAGVNIVHIPYKGTGQAMSDLLGGHVSLMFAAMPGAMPHVRSGKLRALAVTTSARSPAVPELPTVAESGVKNYESVNWYGVVVPSRTPGRIVDKLYSGILSILRTKEVGQLLTDQGAQITGGGPQEFAAYIVSERKRWARVIAETNIRLD